jgi:hypothetical protein
MSAKALDRFRAGIRRLRGMRRRRRLGQDGRRTQSSVQRSIENQGNQAAAGAPRRRRFAGVDPTSGAGTVQSGGVFAQRFRNSRNRRMRTGRCSRVT